MTVTDHSPMLESRPVPQLAIGSRTVGGDAPVLIVAEIGLNHDGSVDRAKELVDRAAEAGADCVKFQMRSLSDLYVNGGDSADPCEDLSVQYVLDVLKRSHLSRGEMFEVFRYAMRLGIECLCTPFDVSSVKTLVDFGLPALKVASADLTNIELLRVMAATGKPLIVSTGMSDENEIRGAVSLLRDASVPFALLHCVSAYPPPFRDIDLRYLSRLRDLSGGVPVGYSSHERGWSVALGAVAQGAAIIEKHISLDRTSPGVDHKVSLLPAEFREMVTGIRQIESALGRGAARKLRHGERIARQALAKSLVARRTVQPNELITSEMVVARSPGRGLPPTRMRELVGRRSRRLVRAGQAFFESDLCDSQRSARQYRFRRPWGIPVRFHDHDALTRDIHPDLVEFHLSARDLEEDPGRFLLRAPYPWPFVLHSPEQFLDDFVFDVGSDDRACRERSLCVLQRVVGLALNLARVFPATRRPLVIVNAGGFSSDRPLTDAERSSAYERVIEGLSQFEGLGVEIILQTLPPFPWHFGGQRFGNLFVGREDTLRYCERTGHRLCLDVAHTFMACVDRGEPFEKWCESLARVTAHLHISDAAGVDGEGLDIGNGHIHFGKLAKILDHHAQNVGFVPEVWEGHWNDGEGFWRALDTLQQWFGTGDVGMIREEEGNGMVRQRVKLPRG